VASAAVAKTLWGSGLFTTKSSPARAEREAASQKPSPSSTVAMPTWCFAVRVSDSDDRRRISASGTRLLLSTMEIVA